MDREAKEKFIVALKFVEEFSNAEEDVREALSQAIIGLIGSGRSLKDVFPKASEAISQLRISFRYDAPKCRILADVWFRDSKLADGVEIFTVHLPAEGEEYFSQSDVLISMNNKGITDLARIILDHLLWLVCEVSRQSDEPAR